MDEEYEEIDRDGDMKECSLCGEYFYPVFNEDLCDTCQEELNEESDD